jgi:prevent-host-death family protein
MQITDKGITDTPLDGLREIERRRDRLRLPPLDGGRILVQIWTMPRKDLELATALVPIGEFRSRTAKLIEAMKDEGRTLVITQNGKAAAVVMSPQDYDALRYQQRFVEEVARGLADVDAGRTQTTAQLRKAMRKRRRGS